MNSKDFQQLLESIREYIEANLEIVEEDLQATEDNLLGDFMPCEECCSIGAGYIRPSEEMSALEIDIEPEESFSEMLLRLIDERGMTDPDAYHKAWVDRRVFSKIRSNKDYTPLKKTAVSFVMALELDPDTAEELLMKAGYALSNSSKWDIIIRYCIEHGIYNLFDVNDILFKFDQPQLG